MPLITTTSALKDFLKEAREQPHIMIDTEFMSEKTYWPLLCVVQIATEKRAVAIDMLSKDLDKQALSDFLKDENVLKVFHSARQDMAIFNHIYGFLPSPVFDTQVAAMVCGFGESAGFKKLVEEIVGETIEKGARFTDWSRRPLSEKQIKYALDDVIYLRPVYQHLQHRIEKDRREHWIKEEMNWLTSDETYATELDEVWRRIKIRTDKPKILNYLRELAAWREKRAQQENIPRGRVLRDDALCELAIQQPRSVDDLGKLRIFPKGLVKSKTGGEILDAIKQADNIDKSNWPKKEKKFRATHDTTAVVDLLKVLLKHVSETHHVANKLIATTEDLKKLASQDDPKIKTLKGWRYEVFGKQALQVKDGSLALTHGDNGVKLVPLS